MDLNEWENWLRPEIQTNVDLIKSYLNKGDTFVDAGANTGLFSKMILDELGYDFLENIILFEPIPYLVSECKNKFKKYSNIKIIDKALGNETSEVTILASNENFGYNKIYKEGMEIHSHEKYTINCVTFSEWMNENKIEKVNFVKIDTEGHDVNVIYGMFDWMESAQTKPNILFETGWYNELEQKLIKDICDKFNYSFIDLGKDVLLIA
jgi:FkbM family methyltransferase